MKNLKGLRFSLFFLLDIIFYSELLPTQTDKIEKRKKMYRIVLKNLEILETGIAFYNVLEKLNFVNYSNFLK